MPYEDWLRRELEDRDACRHVQPFSPLVVRREVVQVLRWPRDERCWSLRFASGAADYPIHDWAIARDLIGKVVGLYRPVAGERT